MANKPLHWSIAHGTFGAPERNWYPWLTWQGIRHGTVVRVPRLPTPKNQSYATWHAAFEDQAGPIDERSVVIGHSTGVPFLLRYLQESQARIAAAFFVSGFAMELPLVGHEELRPLLKSFVDFDFDGSKIAPLAPVMQCFHGDNDDVVPFAAGLGVAKLLGCPMETIKGGRHLNTEAGIFEFQELLRAIQSVPA
jgi:predicted alpha/beta hydrolase family esterase